MVIPLTIFFIKFLNWEPKRDFDIFELAL